MKKIINTPQTVVRELCEGMVSAYPDILAWDEKYNIISRRERNPEKVVLISGGGSGHEPAHGGFVGRGMLDAAVCGDVFASPSIMQVYNGIVRNASKKGVLLIIKNYTGDMMNFGGGADMAVEDDGIKVEKVCVNDDVAIESVPDRRGVAGTVFVHKIAGALAEEGADLPRVKAVAQKVIDNVRSMGFALEPCTVPAKGEPTFSLGENEIEMGIGIHGEAGVVRESLGTAGEIADKIMDKIIKDLPFKGGDEVALLVNGMGGTPLQELFILNKEARRVLDGKGIKIYRTMVGNYMTSIDMVGASLTLLRLDAELRKLLDAPADTAAWIKCG